MSRIIEIDWNPSTRALRGFGLLALVGCVGLAAMAFFEVVLFSRGLGPARGPVTIALAGVGLLAGLFSLVAPRANRPLYVLLSLAAYPVGFVVSYALMVLLFVTLFVPLGIFFRLIGRDSLERRWDQAADSYWRRSHPTRPRKSYFRQF